MRINKDIKSFLISAWELPSKLFKPIASALNVIFGKNNTCRGVPYDVAEEQNRTDPWYQKRGMTSEESAEYFKACSEWVSNTQDSIRGIYDISRRAVKIVPSTPSFWTRIKSRIHRG